MRTAATVHPQVYKVSGLRSALPQSPELPSSFLRPPPVFRRTRMKKFGCLAPFPALLLFSALLPSKALTNAADACSAISAAHLAGKVVPMKSALACVYSFPYDSGRSAAIVDTLYKTFQMHVFKDISIKSPTPEFDVNIDVLGSLSAINRTIYKNDFEFHYAVYSVINALNEVYALYYPRCYSLQTSTAFPLVKFLNPSGIGELVKIASLAGTLGMEFVNATEDRLKLKVADYAGATLLKINNKNPIAFIEQQAKTIGGWRDLNARINQAYYHRIAANGYAAPGFMMSIDLISSTRRSSIKFKLIRVGSNTPETIHVPYFVRYYGDNFTSATDFFTQNCLSMPSPPAAAAAMSASVADVSTSLLDGSKMAARGVQHFRVQIPKNLPTDLQNLDVLKGKRGRRHMKKLGTPFDFIQAFILADRKTGVLYIPFFAFPNVRFVARWCQEIYRGINAIKAAGGTRLILDVQDNFGGVRDLAYALVEYLFPAIANVQYPIQNSDTPLVTQMVYASIKDLEKSSSLLSSTSQYTWAGYGTNASSPFNSGDGFFFPTTPLTYNGKTSQYSSLYYPIDRLGSPFGFDYMVPTPGDITPKFVMNQTIILSNGGCHTECSTFSSLMQEAGVKIISVGGSLGKPMAHSSGAVGYPYYLDSLLQYDLGYLNLTKAAGAPQPLPVQAFVLYTPAQSFSPQSSTIPASFLFQPADYRISFTKASVESVEALYKQAAKYFP